MSGTATKGEKFKAAFGVISKNVLADKKKQVGLVLDQLDTALDGLEQSTKDAQLAYHPGKKGVAEDYKPLRVRFDAVETAGLTEKKAFAEYDAIEKQAKAGLKSVPALHEAAKQMVAMKDKSNDEIDTLVAQLGSKVSSDEDKGKMIAAIKVRFGVDELSGELTSNMLPRLYKALKLVPDNHTKDNPKLSIITRSKMSDTSLYGSGVLNINAGETGPFSSEKEKYTDGAGKALKFNNFDAHTLHEVGHSVDDASGYMAAHGTDDNYGGWSTHSESQIAGVWAKKLAKDYPELGPAFLSDLASDAILKGNVNDAVNAWKGKQAGFTSIGRDTLLQDGAVVEADTAVKQLKDTVTVPLNSDDRQTVEAALNLTQVMKKTTQTGPARMFVLNFVKAMRDNMVPAKEAADQMAAALAALDDTKKIAKIAAGPIDWVKVVSKELWFASSGVVDKSAIEGRVYQKDGSKWLSYVLTARSKMVRNYQFRSPAEWFAEVYAVSMLGKLSSTHPCANDIKTIDTTKKIGT